MKKILFMLLCLSIFCINGYTQLSTKFSDGFMEGFKRGYCYGNPSTDCFYPKPPFSPSPNLNENKDRYEDGYNRGFQTGLDLYRVHNGGKGVGGSLYKDIPGYRFNDYIPQIPVDEAVNILMYKQMLYDSRVAWIQSRINSIHDLMTNLLSGTDYETYKKVQSDFVANTTRNFQGRRDWADNSLFQQAVDYFRKWERHVSSVYNSLLE